MSEYKDTDDKCLLAMYYITKRINEKCHQCHEANDWSWFNRMVQNIDLSKLTIDRTVSLYTTVRWAKGDFVEWDLFVDKVYNNWLIRDVDQELINWVQEDLTIN